MIAGPEGQNCSELVDHPILKLSGARTTTLYVDNPDRHAIDRVDVDGCAIWEGVRCDWLLLTNEPLEYEEIYIELKRSDVASALAQLETSIHILSADVSGCRKRCYVVSRRNPMTGTDVTRAKQRFKKIYSALFTLVRDGATVPLAV